MINYPQLNCLAARLFQPLQPNYVIGIIRNLSWIRFEHDIFENKDALTYNNRYSSFFIDSISRFYSHVINAHLVDFPAIVVDCGTLIAPTWSFHPAMAANWAGVLC